MKRHVAVIAVSLVVANGCRSGQPPKATTKMPVETVPVRTMRSAEGDIGREVRLTGSLVADNTIQLATRITARVVEAPFREGMSVRKGDLLIRQDTIDLANQERAARAAVTQAIAGVASAQAAVRVAETRLEQARTQAKVQTTSSAGTVADAEAQLRSAQAQLEIARRPQRGQEVVVAESSVAQAQANLEKAAQDRRRYAQLVADGAASKSQLDQYVNQEKIAKATLDSASAQLDIARTGGREESIRSAESAVRRAEVGVQLAKSNVQLDRVREDDVRSAEASLEQSRSALLQAKATLASANASLDRSRQDMANAVLRAPIDGVVATRSAEVGQLLGPGTPAISLVTSGQVHFDALVPETDIARLVVGGAVEVTIDALSGRARQGRIGRIYPVGSSSSRNFTVRVDIDGEDGSERPGMFVRGRVGVDRHSAILVSKDAIVKTESDEDSVFVIRDGAAYRKRVRLGIVGDKSVEIVEGIESNAEVVVAGQSSLKDGVRVTVRGEESAER